MKLSYHTIQLPFVYPFTISKGTKTHQPSLIVRLEHQGHCGYGEAPAISYYDVSVERMVEVIQAKRTLIERFALTEPARYWHYLHHLLPSHPFLVCALDMAAWDLFGKLRGMSLMKYWGLEEAKMPMTDYTIGIDTPDKMLQKMKANPWPIYKIKVGGEQDLAAIRLLRSHTDAVFRVDANAAWNVETALKYLPALNAIGVELVEQPLAKEDWEGMKRLMEVSPLPLIADESCVEEKDVSRCAGFFHGINIKLTKCSGITPAMRMIEDARSLGLQVMIGSMNESTVGSSAIAHLSPLVDYVDNDGPLLLAEDVATGLYYKQGSMVISGKAGLGIDFKSAF